MNLRGFIAREERGAVPLAPFKEMCVVDEAVFDDLGIARPQFARRQGSKRARIDEHQGRLMEGADQILSRRRVDGGLAAHRRIHLRRERGRRSEEHTSELQSLMRISYAVFCLKKKNKNKQESHTHITTNNNCGRAYHKRSIIS